jgi:ribose/xylose/arabinose/galactoside ABC-type transport system permease subunit
MGMTSFVNKIKKNYSVDTVSFLRILLIFGALVVLAQVLSQGVFLQASNLVNLAKQNTILIIVALGQLLIIITGGIDLSVGSVLALSSVLFVLFQDYGLGIAILLTLLVSSVVGLLNGVLVTFVKLPSFVVTLATSLIVSSIAMVTSGGGTISTSLGGVELSESLTTIYNSDLLGVPYPILFFLVALFVIGIFLRTSTGHFAYALGGNAKAAYISGLPVKRVNIIVYVVASLLAGIGGILFVARVGLANPQTGANIPLDSIASVSIGGASLSGGIGTVPGTFIGVFALAVLSNIMNLMNVTPTLQYAIKGIVILVAVYLNSVNTD